MGNDEMKLPKNTSRIKQASQDGAMKPFQAGQALDFAQSVLARYGGQYRRVPPVALDWLHNRLNIMLFQTERSSNIYFAPRLTLTLAVQTPLSSAKASAAADSRLWPMVGQQQLGRLQNLPDRTMETQLLGPHEPSARRQRAGLAASVPGYLVEKKVLRERSSLHLVPRVFHRKSSPQLPVEDADSARQSLRPPTTPFPTPANHSAMRGAGDVNIQQLTDDVIQAIDRRIIAQRERMGKL
jgi:hypothetical protein